MTTIPNEPFLRSVSLRRDRIASFDEYPFSIPAIRHLHALELHPNVTFLIGENGTGKSTLLEAIAVSEGFNPEGGSRNFAFKTRDTHSHLYQYLQPNRGIRRARHDAFFLRAESFYNVATWVDSLGFDPAKSPYGTRSLHEQSHGEAFLTMFVERFSGNGLYLLDEPESALSPQRQLTFLAALHELVLRKSQFIIATHSPIILAYPHSRIYECSVDGIREVEYTDTQHYRVTCAFLNRREQMLRDLLSPADDE
ncbi:MAG: AAA family ATPase [Pirellulaceae bacterium]|nr:AAA family ATPase [Pirellulaceae bacterium]